MYFLPMTFSTIIETASCILLLCFSLLRHFQLHIIYYLFSLLCTVMLRQTLSMYCSLIQLNYLFCFFVPFWLRSILLRIILLRCFFATSFYYFVYCTASCYFVSLTASWSHHPYIFSDFMFTVYSPWLVSFLMLFHHTILRIIQLTVCIFHDILCCFAKSSRIATIFCICVYSTSSCISYQWLYWPSSQLLRVHHYYPFFTSSLQLHISYYSPSLYYIVMLLWGLSFLLRHTSQYLMLLRQIFMHHYDIPHMHSFTFIMCSLPMTLLTIIKTASCTSLLFVFSLRHFNFTSFITHLRCAT